jgi:1-acyl-sn-glycerol-3-phosphate acyltransferase
VDSAVLVCRAIIWPLFGFRVHNRDRIPREGALIYVCNHQSYLDPILCGIASRDRPARPLARQELFKFLPLRLFLKSLGTLSLSGSARDKSAFRITLAELEAGRTVMLFPEGSRSFDGSIAEFKPGVGLLLKRSKATVVPIGIDGAFDAWPRTGRIRLGRRVECEVGEPIGSEELLKDGVAQAISRLKIEVDQLRMRCRERIRTRTGGRQPASGPGDAALSRDVLQEKSL